MYPNFYDHLSRHKTGMAFSVECHEKGTKNDNKVHPQLLHARMKEINEYIEKHGTIVTVEKNTQELNEISELDPTAKDRSEGNKTKRTFSDSIRTFFISYSNVHFFVVLTINSVRCGHTWTHDNIKNLIKLRTSRIEHVHTRSHSVDINTQIHIYIHI